MRGAQVTMLLFALFVPCMSVSALARDSNRPIMKIVRMLEDMKAELNKELEDDKAVQEMLDCWCGSNGKEKAKSIQLAEARISELEAQLGETLAKIKELKSKRKATQEEQFADQKALDEAEDLRIKELKEFQTTETDLLGAVAATKNAIVALSSQNPEFAQVKSVARALQMAKVPEMIMKSGAFDNFKMQALKEFLTSADKEPSFLATPGMQSYAPQSGQIFGILKQMKEDFEVDLGEEQTSEKKAVSEFEQLKAAKISEIDTSKAAIVQFDADIANLGEQNSEAMTELEDTESQLADDKTFLASLDKKCAASDEDFEKRVKDRLAEIAAVEDTIKILNDDSAFANFGKTVNSFLQISSKQETQMRQQAVRVLRRAAAKSQNPKLALVAISAQLDAFVEVKVEIDKMVAELKAQQKDEIDTRDVCIEDLNTNKRETDAGYEEKSQLETRIADLEQHIKTLTTNIETAVAAIADAQNQMGRRSETREAENADYQQTVQDQRLTQMILQKAIDRMTQVYGLLQGPGGPHTQTSATRTDPGNGPASFKKYEANAGGKKVLVMLDDVLTDSKTMENDAIVAEEDAQTAYENFMKDSNKMIISTTKAITDMTESKAKDQSDLTMTQTDFKQQMTQLEGLNTESADLHKSCDFLIKNFDARQAARAGEIDALGEAKAILSGMN